MTDELYVWIERWGDFQDFQKKRGKPWVPPWIKLYPALLDEPRFLDLTPETRSLLVGLFMLFARSRGTITKDTRRLSRQLNQRVTERQLETLNQAGWIRFCSGTVREQLWNAFWNGSSLEVEEEVEVEKEQPVPVPVPVPNYAGTGTGTADEDIPPAAPTEPNGAGAEERWKTGQDIQTLDPTTILRGVA